MVTQDTRFKWKYDGILVFCSDIRAIKAKVREYSDRILNYRLNEGGQHLFAGSNILKKANLYMQVLNNRGA